MFFRAIQELLTPLTEEEQSRFPTWTEEEKALPCRVNKTLKPPVTKKEILPLYDVDIPCVNAGACIGEDLQPSS